MGEAKRRGTFEERQAEAIAAEARRIDARDVRTSNKSPTTPRNVALGAGLALAAILGMMR
jgi:hypothetical protein